MALQAAILEDLLPTMTKIRYAELASSMIILYDHGTSAVPGNVLTLDQEIHLFWHAQWSLGKVLFLINRYYALCVVVFNNYVLFNNTLTDSFCLRWYIWQGCTGVFMFVIAEMILQLRLYALYFRDKRILALTTFVCVGAALSAAYVMGHALYFVTVLAYAVKLPLSSTTVCVPFGLPRNFYAFWIPMLISESVLCGLALYRGFGSYRAGANVIQSGKRIIDILVRDSLSYFIIIFATYLMNTIIFLTRPGAEVEIPVGFAVALSSVMSSRLCLNVRQHIHTDGADCILSGSLPRSPPLSPVLSPSHPHSNPHRGRTGTGGMAFETFSLNAASKGVERDQEMTGSAESSSLGHSTVVLGARLSDMEMRELGVVRAPSTKHLRVVSVSRNQNGSA